MRVAGLFAGIGGIELGLHESGHETEFLCDIDPHAQAVLRQRFDAPVVGDISQLDPNDIPDVDLITAGFPCQDLSQAGGTGGIKGAKSGVVRHLFEVLRAKRPKWLLIENVSFMLKLDRGRAMSYLTEHLGDLGYQWAYRVLDSRAFTMPQRRQRVFLLASREMNPAELLFGSSVEPPKDTRDPKDFEGKACGFYWTEGTRGLGWAIDSIPTLKGGSTVGVPSPPAVWLPNGRSTHDSELTIFTPSLEDAESLQGFERGWTSPAAEIDAPRGNRYRWKLVGNAVTVDVAAWVGSVLARMETTALPESSRLGASDPWPRAAFGNGAERFEVPSVTTWPFEESPLHLRRRRPLAEWLRNPRPLSARATRGFLRRFQSSQLRKPLGFIPALEQHLRAMESQTVAAAS